MHVYTQQRGLYHIHKIEPGITIHLALVAVVEVVIVLVVMVLVLIVPVVIVMVVMVLVLIVPVVIVSVVIVMVVIVLVVMVLVVMVLVVMEFVIYVSCQVLKEVAEQLILVAMACDALSGLELDCLQTRNPTKSEAHESEAHESEAHESVFLVCNKRKYNSSSNK